MCECLSSEGESKVMYPERLQATRNAGAKMGPEGKMWQVYRCPGGTGWHISTVRWDPWSTSE